MSVDPLSLREDDDVVQPFVQRLLERIREKHPAVTMQDISILIEVREPSDHADFVMAKASVRIRKLLADMDRDGIKL